LKRVVFDTDIGIDDAMALLFLHYAPGVRLEAITTVSGNASIGDTTRNALYVKERFAIDAPVFRGASGPVGPALGSGYPDFIHGSNGLGNIPLPEPGIGAELTPAPEAIVELAERYPGELSLVAVGRLTNLSKALDLSPRLPTLLKEIVIMGGVFGYRGNRGNVSPVAEANIAGDALAADRVLGTGIPITLVGLDVTHETTMDEAYIEALVACAGDAGAFIRDITRFYFDFYESIDGERRCPIHDSSAVACLLYPELYRRVSGPVRVVTTGIATGQSILGEQPDSYAIDAWKDRPSCQVCSDVDAEEVRQRYLETMALAGR
jgi:purine nucleosidase